MVVKHGDALIMVWSWFTAFGLGPLVKIEGIMNGEMYRDILRNNLSLNPIENLCGILKRVVGKINQK